MHRITACLIATCVAVPGLLSVSCSGSGGRGSGRGPFSETAIEVDGTGPRVSITRSGLDLAFRPGDLVVRNAAGAELQRIAPTLSTSEEVDGVTTFTDLYGAGLDLQLLTSDYRVAKVLRIDAPLSLPAGAATLELEEAITFTPSLAVHTEEGAVGAGVTKAASEILFTAAGEPVFRIPAAVGWDSSGQNDNPPLMSYVVSRTAAGSVKLVTRVATRWLADPARLFPVFLDPIIEAPCATDYEPVVCWSVWSMPMAPHGGSTAGHEPRANVSVVAREALANSFNPLRIWIQSFPGSNPTLAGVSDTDANVTSHTGGALMNGSFMYAGTAPGGVTLDSVPGKQGTWTVVITVAQNADLANFKPISDPCRFDGSSFAGTFRVAVPVTVARGALPTGESSCGGGSQGGVPSVQLDGVIVAGSNVGNGSGTPIDTPDADAWELTVGGLDIGSLKVSVAVAGSGIYTDTTDSLAVGNANGTFWFPITALPCDAHDTSTAYDVRVGVYQTGTNTLLYPVFDFPSAVSFRCEFEVGEFDSSVFDLSQFAN